MKLSLTPSQLAENIFDLISGTSFAHHAQNEIEEYLEDKELTWSPEGYITITDEDTDQELYKITITKTVTKWKT